MRKQHGASAGRIQQSRPEFESTFQELYKSLLGSQEYVAENVALKEKYCAGLIAREDLSNYRASQNFTQSSKKPPQEIYKVEHSIQKKHITLKDSSSNVRVAGTCSATTETAKLSAKTPNIKCDIFPYKAETNTETGFSPKRQQTLQIQGSSPTIGVEALYDDDSMSIQSGEDYRETVTCETCSETFWKVVNKKNIRKRQRELDKKQPHDPTSLSCDQWVLKKPLLPRGNLHKYRREIETPVTYLKSLGWPAQTRDAKKWIPQCSRPHMFLHRNLRSCKRKVDEFLHDNGKRAPRIKARKRSRKKNLFVYKLPEAHPSANVLSGNEDSEFEMKNCSVKRKLASAVLNREVRSKKDGCDFSDDSNTCESGFCSSDSRSMQCDNSICPRKDKFALDVFGSETTSAFSTSAVLCTENRLYSQFEEPKLWQETPDKNSTDPLSSSFSWLKPGGFTYMIAKLKAGHQTLPGTVVKET